MCQQRPIRSYDVSLGIASSNGGKKLALKPATVLVGSLEANVRPWVGTLPFRKERPRRAAIEPHIHGVGALAPVAQIRIIFLEKGWEEVINRTFPPIGDTPFVQYGQDVIKGAGIEICAVRWGMV